MRLPDRPEVQSSALTDLPARVFAERVASCAPTPGGGSVAAIAGALGAALISMVCRLSLPMHEEAGEELHAVLSIAEAARSKLINLVEEDAQAYNAVIAARAKREELQAALEHATLVPLEVAKECLRLLEMAKQTAEEGNPNALSDVGVAALMAFAGARGAAYNVKINLHYIKDTKFMENTMQGLSELEENTASLFDEVTEIIDRRLTNLSQALHGCGREG